MPKSNPPPKSSLLKRILTALFWSASIVLGLLGLLFLGLVIAGIIQFSILDCGPRSEWTQANYSACSDIDETNPIFLVIGLVCLCPVVLALLLRWMARATKDRSS